MKASELRAQRAELVKKARAILTRADGEKRDTNTEENSEYDKIMQEVDALKARIDKLEKLEDVEEEQDAPAERSGRRATGEERERHRTGTQPSEGEIRSAFNAWARTGRAPAILRADPSRLESIPGEFRDVVLGAVGSDTGGGYLVTPTQISNAVVKQIDSYTFFRQLAHIERVTEAKSLGVRQISTRISDANWTTEVAELSADTSLAFGRRDLTPSALTKLALVSIRMLMASPDVANLVNLQIAYKFAVAMENGFLTGSGSGQPLGVFTASSSGIPTSQDIGTTNVGSLIGDDLINAKFNLRQPYLVGPKASWIFHRSIVALIRKLKDNYGQYMWTPGLAGGAPDMILDVPYRMSDFAPSTVTSGDYIGIIGNFEYYWIAEVIDIIMQRLVERYSDTNEVGFKAITFADGAPILGEAFTRIIVQ